ncbi:MAG: penicillin-binding transpeptidase domain-containing protein [Planctomycetota bacterium]|jgi:penicillin-binding protein 2
MSTEYRRMSRYDPVLCMFHRRLLVLFGAMVLVMIGLTLQAGRLAVGQGEMLRDRAESRLSRRTFIATRRGDILDRNGQRLAADRASYSIAVRFDLITGEWASDQARRQARREAGREWARLSPEVRNELINGRFADHSRRADAIWRAIELSSGLPPDEIDQRRGEIKSRVEAMASHVQGAQREAWERQTQRRAESQFGRVDREGPEFKAQPIREQMMKHVILPRVSVETAHAFQRMALNYDGLIEVIDDTRRHYPWDTVDVPVPRAGLPGHLRSDEPLIVRVAGVADHVLGRIRNEAWAEDIRRRPFIDEEGTVDFGGYRAGDRVGASGLEAVFESRLRGERGQETQQLGTDVVTRREPIPGEDLSITLDVALQSRVQALLSHEVGLTVVQPWHHNPIFERGRPLNSGAVVLDVETSEILALVSMPTLAMGDAMDALTRQVIRPDINRPVEGVYPPGSILKPLVLASAVMNGTHDLQRGITCNGHFFPDNESNTRCWIYRPVYQMATHGELHAAEAIGRSCNIYFYTLASDMGLMGTSAWLQRFGLGSRLDIGLARVHTTVKRDAEGETVMQDGKPVPLTFVTGESTGTIPTSEHRADAVEQSYLPSLSAIVGIGQGPITWSPVQAANAYAMLARGGSVRDATLILNDTRERPRREDLDIPSAVHRAALEGLRASVEERWGTGYRIKMDDESSHTIINVSGVTCYMKTGTAQAPPLRDKDLNGDGLINRDDGDGFTNGDHSWVVGLVGPSGERPTHAIAVLIEYGGSGGRVSGPIANEIIRALQAEGYLPGGEVARIGGEA